MICDHAVEDLDKFSLMIVCSDCKKSNKARIFSLLIESSLVYFPPGLSDAALGEGI